MANRHGGRMIQQVIVPVAAVVAVAMGVVVGYVWLSAQTQDRTRSNSRSKASATPRVLCGRGRASAPEIADAAGRRSGGPPPEATKQVVEIAPVNPVSEGVSLLTMPATAKARASGATSTNSESHPTSLP